MIKSMRKIIFTIIALTFSVVVSAARLEILSGDVNVLKENATCSFVLDLTNATFEQKENFMNNLLGIWDSGYQNIANLLNGEGGFSTQVLEMLTSSGEAVGEFKNTVNGVLENTGEKVKDWATLISDETFDFLPKIKYPLYRNSFIILTVYYKGSISL